jgi:hypothetical protein
LEFGPVEKWRNENGDVFAAGWQHDGVYLIDVPEVGTFRFAVGSGVTAVPLPGTDEAAVREAHERIVVPLALQVQGGELIHASAVVGPRGVVAFCAGTHIGKSTLAYGLSLRGYPIWADDAVLFVPSDGLLESVPLPFSLRIRPPSARFFGLGQDASLESPLFEAHDDPRPFAAVCLLEPNTGSTSDATVEVARSERGSAFLSLLSHAFYFTISDTPRTREMFDNYLKLAERVRVFDVRFRHGLEHMPVLLNRIEEAVIQSDSAEHP